MKVIDLLNKVANGEELPEKFKYINGAIYHKSNDGYYDENGCKWRLSIVLDLNNEIEIIEEDKKIEKLDNRILLQRRIEDMGTPLEEMLNKINEIIDKINEVE